MLKGPNEKPFRESQRRTPSSSRVEARLRPTNADAIASTLAESGVEFVFGLPGGEIAPLIEACRNVGIRFLLTGHEASAAFMAEVTGQILGRPGVCVSTLGPGAMNMALGLANAFLDRSPVVAITADISTAIRGHFPHQRLPLTSIFGSICKASFAFDGDGTADLTAKAINLASHPPYGPVHLSLPSDVAVAHPISERVTAHPDVTLPNDQMALTEIAEMLSEAKRPILLIGLGCRPEDTPALVAFLERTRMPFVVTPKAKGSVPEDRPDFLGVVGGVALDKAIMETVDEADFILGVGFDPVECDKPWYVGRAIANISRFPTAEGAYRPVESLGDVGTQLSLLSETTQAKPWPQELISSCASRLRVRPKPGRGVSPIEVIYALREMLPKETILTSDVGSHKYFACQFWRALAPRTFYVSNGLSAMGFGIPAGIAAKLQFPECPVVALVGDGGFLMMLHNLTFLKQYHIPLIVVCLVDESLSLIKLGQQRRGFVPYGVDFPAPDFTKVAAGFDIRAVWANSIANLRRSVDESLQTNEPVVVSIPVDSLEYEEYA